MPRVMLFVTAIVDLSLLTCVAALAQSGAAGTVVVKEDFESGSETPDPRQWSMASWNVPDTWQLRDGAIAGIYDKVKLKAKSHGKSLNSRLAARDIRVSYRLKLEKPGSRLTMIINAGMPAKTGFPLWHVGRVVARLGDDADVTIVEDNFTRDRHHPDAKGQPNAAAWLRNFTGGDAWVIPGKATKAKAGLEQGKWHRFVVENVGTQWTVWVDGTEVATARLEHSDIDKESANFISDGAILIDDIVVERLSAAPSP